jgi:thioester reductase-like protein
VIEPRNGTVIMREAPATGTWDWLREAALDPHIGFACATATRMEAPGHVLVTGATGFLGAHVLDELLRTSTAQLYCLVRAAGPAAGVERLRAQLVRLGLPGAALLEARITAVVGDLGLPRLGLSPAAFDELAERIDVIYHTGAHVDFLRSYAALKAPNVGGTTEVLRLAATGRAKPVHHTSSLAVFFGPSHAEGRTVSERDTPPLVAIGSGYAQSKLVAERLVAAACERGIQAAIYRTGRIGGHSRTGATSNAHDLVNLLLKGCILLGAYPGWAHEVAVVPVDHVSRAMVHLARQPRSLGHAFHLFQPQPIAWRELAQLVVAHGYPMVELPHERWQAALKQAAQSAHAEREALARLWMLLASPHGLFAGRPRYETPCSDEGLAGTAIRCPPIDAQLVGTYLGFFQASGYIPPPPGGPPPRGA